MRSGTSKIVKYLTFFHGRQDSSKLFILTPLSVHLITLNGPVPEGDKENFSAPSSSQELGAGMCISLILAGRIASGFSFKII